MNRIPFQQRSRGLDRFAGRNAFRNVAIFRINSQIILQDPGEALALHTHSNLRRQKNLSVVRILHLGVAREASDIHLP